MNNVTKTEDQEIFERLSQSADIVFSEEDIYTFMASSIVKESISAFEKFMYTYFMKRFDVRPELGNPLEETLLKVRTAFYAAQEGCGWQLEFKDYMEMLIPEVKFLFNKEDVKSWPF